MNKIYKLFCALCVISSLLFGFGELNAQSVGTPNGNTSSFFNTNTTGRLLGHREVGTFGSFGLSSQWIGIGQPTISTSSSTKVPAYGLRSQWLGQAGIFALKEQPSGSMARDLVIEWGSNTNTRLKFNFIENLNNPSALKEIMTITPAGNGGVGIGTTNPIGTLDLNTTQSLGGSVTYGINNRVTGSNYGFYGSSNVINITSSFFGYGITGNATTASSAFIYGAYLRANTSSTTGMGTYGVYAQATAPTGASNVWAGYFQGDVYISGSLTVASDKKFKKNIKPLSNSTVSSKLMSLKPSSYSYKNTESLRFSEGLQYGFLAQEVEEVFPDLVKDVAQPVYDGVDETGNPKIVEGKMLEFKSINYIGLIPILTKAMQEQETKLVDYQERFVAYEAELAEQKAINEEQRVVNEELRKKLDQVLSTISVEGQDTGNDQVGSTETSLGQNQPNPFGTATAITYTLSNSVRQANIQIYNMDGKLIGNYPLDKNENAIQLQANEYQPGVYIYVMMADGKTIGTRRMIVSQ